MVDAQTTADILRARGVSKVLYFHCDHFEPWSGGINEATARAVQRFGQQSVASTYGDRLSLFYSTYNPYGLAPTNAAIQPGACVSGDAVLFQTHLDRNKEVHALASDVIRPLSQPGNHEFHLHVHHEWWTSNSYNLNSPVSRWVNQQNDVEVDGRRLDLFIKVSTKTIASEIGRPFDTWAFVHGNWALCASDDQICRVQNELEILMSNGGWGDFSFPAGRGHCDPVLRQPFTCLPARGQRAFDAAAAKVMPIGILSHAISPERFFIWNSVLTAEFSSIDYYDSGNRERFKTPERYVDAWARRSFVLGDVLFLKTHAHSMKPEYKMSDDDALVPHAYTPVVSIFDAFRRVCDIAHVEFKKVTVNEALDEIQRLDGTLPEKTLSSAAVALPDKLAETQLSVSTYVSSWARKSDVDGSLGDYYSCHLRAGDDLGLRHYEQAIAHYILHTYSVDEIQLVEIGAGLGLLSGVLAMSGIETIAIEGDKTRFSCLQRLSEFVARQCDRNLLRPVDAWFPAFKLGELLSPHKKNIAVLTNVVASAIADNQDQVLRSLALFDHVVIDTARFGVVRDQDAAGRFENMLNRRFLRRQIVYDHPDSRVIHYETSLKHAAGGLTGESKLARALKLHAEEICKVRQNIAKTGGIPSDAGFDRRIASGTFVEPFELAAATQLLATHRPEETIIVEIGIGQGGLAATLARAGYQVLGFEGSQARASAARALAATLEKEVADRLDITPGLFPLELDPRKLTVKPYRVGIATNLVTSYSAENQNLICRAFLHFDKIALDVSRFGVPRDNFAEKDAFIRMLCTSHFESAELLERVDTHEFWCFRTKPFF